MGAETDQGPDPFRETFVPRIENPESYLHFTALLIAEVLEEAHKKKGASPEAACVSVADALFRMHRKFPAYALKLVESLSEMTPALPEFHTQSVVPFTVSNGRAEEFQQFLAILAAHRGDPEAYYAAWRLKEDDSTTPSIIKADIGRLRNSYGNLFNATFCIWKGGKRGALTPSEFRATYIQGGQSHGTGIVSRGDADHGVAGSILETEGSSAGRQTNTGKPGVAGSILGD